MDEYHGPGRDHNGRHGLVTAGIFSNYHYFAGQDGGHTAVPGHDVHGTVQYGTGVTCQNNLYGSRIGSAERSADGKREAPDGARSNAYHVQPVSDVQTTLLSPLSDMQSMHISDGSSLSLDE